MFENKCRGWYEGDNERIFKILSIFLNLAPDYITPDMIHEIAGDCPDDKSIEFAFASIAAAACGLDVYDNQRDKNFFREYFLPCFHLLDESLYTINPFYRNISFPEGKSGNWTFEKRICKPFEAFVFDDPEVTKLPGQKYKVIPQIGFFKNAYPYPAVLEGGREWMTLMPNETNTSEEAVSAAEGRVLTYGLGLGYFTYMAAIKPTVDSVTVVERSDNVISLFREHILPQFPDPTKVNIIKSDAFEFAENSMADGNYDMVFTDLWHDPSDGVKLYKKMKSYEHLLPNAKYVYWIEKTLELYF